MSLQRPSTVNVLAIDKGSEPAAAPVAPRPADSPKPRRRRAVASAASDSDSDVSTVDEVQDIGAVTFSTDVTVHKVPPASHRDGGTATGAGAGAGAGADEGADVDDDEEAVRMLAHLGDDACVCSGRSATTPSLTRRCWPALPRAAQDPFSGCNPVQLYVERHWVSRTAGDATRPLRKGSEL